MDATDRTERPHEMTLSRPGALMLGVAVCFALTGCTVADSGRVEAAPTASPSTARAVSVLKARGATGISTCAGDLVGMRVADGQRILPLLQLRVVPDATLHGIELDDTDASGHPGTTTLPIKARFAAGRC